jgi:hypothetical protein
MKKLLLGLVALFMSVNLYASELIVNGGFEDPVTADNTWMTYYGMNGPGDGCTTNNAPNNCNDGTLVPGWYAWWVSSILDDQYADVDGFPTPGRIEIQNGNVGGVLPHGGNQKAELDTHHNTDGSNNNNIVLFQFVPVCHGREYTLSYAWKSRTSTPDDNDMNVIVDDISFTTMAASHAMNDTWEMGETTFTASDVLIPVAFFSTGSETTLGMFVDDVSLVGDSPDECANVCEIGKPTSMTYMYNGERGSDNSQDDDYALPVRPIIFQENPVTIEAFDYNGNKKRKSLGEVNGIMVGDLFTLDRPLKNGKVPPKTLLIVTDEFTGDLVQAVYFHTSCSQPLNVGDKFGVITVRGFNN